MIEQTTYFVAKCDACKDSFGISMPTFEEQCHKLISQGWFVRKPTNEAICPSCRKIADKVAEIKKI